MKWSQTAILCAAISTSGCISTGGSVFDLIPLSEKVLMTAGTKPDPAATNPISVEELLQRARVSDAPAGDQTDQQLGPRVIDVTAFGEELTGGAVVTLGTFMRDAKSGGIGSVIVETSTEASILSPASRHSITMASILRKGLFSVELDRTTELTKGQIRLTPKRVALAGAES